MGWKNYGKCRFYGVELLAQEVCVSHMDFHLKRVEKVDYLSSQDTLHSPFYETKLIYISYVFLLKYKIQILHIDFDDLFHARLPKLSIIVSTIIPNYLSIIKTW